MSSLSSSSSNNSSTAWIRYCCPIHTSVCVSIWERQFASNRLIPKNIKNEYNNRKFWIEMHNMRVQWKDINACTYFSVHGFHPTRSVDVPKRRVVWGSIVRIYIAVYRSPYTSDMHHCQRYVTCNMRNFFPNAFMLKQTLDFVNVRSVSY